MKREIIHGAVNQSSVVFIQDSSSTTGAGLTGLVYNSASLTAYYARPLEVAAAISLVTQTVTGAHTDGGFKEIDATNMPGFYRIDWPDAMFVKGKSSVAAMLKGATDMAPLPLEFMLDDRQGYNVLLDTTIATVTDQTHFTLTDAPDDDNALLNATAQFIENTTLAKSFRDVTSHVGATKAIITESGADHTVVSGQRVLFMASARAITTAEVNAEVVDALITDTYAEPSSVPAATSSIKDKMNWLFALARNKGTQTPTTKTLRNDDDDGNIATSGISSDGATFTRGEWS